MSNTIDNVKTTNPSPANVRPQAKGVARDQLLSDIRSGRRLERIVESIRHFLEMQVSKVEDTLVQCEAAVENDRRLHQKMAEFQQEKHQWNETRKLEVQRLSAAGDELAKAWEQLEAERRKFVDSKTN